MVCRDCIVLAHTKTEGHELQELNEVKAEYVLTLEQLRIRVEDTIRRRQEQLSCLRTELDTMDIVSEVSLVHTKTISALLHHTASSAKNAEIKLTF